MTVDAPTVKACCAAAYGSEAARWLLGDRLHPGGAELTGRLIAALGLAPGRVLADVACGPGASAVQAAMQTGCDVVGLDLAPENVELAERAADAAGLRPAPAIGDLAERAADAAADRFTARARLPSPTPRRCRCRIRASMPSCASARCARSRTSALPPASSPGSCAPAAAWRCPT